MTLESGVLAVAAKGPLTLEAGVLAVLAKGRLAPLVALTEFNFPRFLHCATFAAPRDRGAMPHSRGADDPRTFWRGVFANGRMGLLQNVSEGCWPANNAESMVRDRAGDTGGDWESNLSQAADAPTLSLQVPCPSDEDAIIGIRKHILLPQVSIHV